MIKIIYLLIQAVRYSNKKIVLKAAF